MGHWVSERGQSRFVWELRGGRKEAGIAAFSSSISRTVSFRRRPPDAQPSHSVTSVTACPLTRLPSALSIYPHRPIAGYVFNFPNSPQQVAGPSHRIVVPVRAGKIFSSTIGTHYPEIPRRGHLQQQNQPIDMYRGKPYDGAGRVLGCVPDDWTWDLLTGSKGSRGGFFFAEFWEFGGSWLFWCGKGGRLWTGRDQWLSGEYCLM
jgi:hypothetical protein